MGHMFMAYIVMAGIGMAYIVMADVVMAYTLQDVDLVEVPAHKTRLAAAPPPHLGTDIGVYLWPI